MNYIAIKQIKLPGKTYSFGDVLENPLAIGSLPRLVMALKVVRVDDHELGVILKAKKGGRLNGAIMRKFTFKRDPKLSAFLTKNEQIGKKSKLGKPEAASVTKKQKRKKKDSTNDSDNKGDTLVAHEANVSPAEVTE